MSFAPTTRPGPRPRTAWRDRVEVLGTAAGLDSARLAELVEAERERSAEVLFTDTPTEELDEIARWGRLGDAAWCGMVRAIVAADARMSPTEREFLACEVGLGRNLGPDAAEDLVATARLAASAPGLVDAVEAGLLTVGHVYAVVRAFDGTGLSSEEQHAVVTVALARYEGHTPGQLADLVRKLILTIDGAAAAAREADRTAQRRVRFRAVEDGQGVITARGPLAQVEAVRAALEHTLPLTTDPDDPRSRDAREFDLLVDLLTGGWDRVPEGAQQGGWHASIVVPYSTADGADLELAEIPGLGPVLPETAREVLAAAVTVTRVAVDADGNVLEVSDVLPGPAARATDADPRSWLHELAAMPIKIGVPAGSPAYRPGTRLRRYVEARDRTCTFPGCTRPAIRCDKDHDIPWPLGPTHPDHLHDLCRRHHRAKQTIFTVLRLPDGTTRWITRGGWWFDRPPRRW
jgi:hypothetical protein